MLVQRKQIEIDQWFDDDAPCIITFVPSGVPKHYIKIYEEPDYHDSEFINQEEKDKLTNEWERKSEEEG